MSHFKKLLFCLFLVLYSLVGCIGQNLVAINGQDLEPFEELVDIFPYIQVLSVEKEVLDLEEAQALKEVLQKPIASKAAYLFQLDITNKAAIYKDYVLYFGYEHLIEVQGFGTSKILGTMVPDREKIGNLKSGFFLRDEGFSGQIALTLEAQTTATLKVKVKRVFNKPMAFDFKLYEADYWEEQMELMRRPHFSQGVFQGIIWGLILYHIFFFLMVKDITYIYYCLYMLCISVLTLGDFGYLQGTIFKNQPFGAWAVFHIFQYVTGIMTFVFMQQFVNLKTLLPKWNKRVSLFIRANILMLVLMMLSYLIFGDFLIVQLGKFLIVPFALMGFLFCVLLVRSGDKVALYFAVAGAILSFSVAINALLEQMEGPMMASAFARYYFLQIATSVHLLTFSIGMGYRSRQIDLERQRRIELDQLKTRLYTNITHEFRTPLTVIMGETENIKGNNQQRNLIYRNGQNLLRLINQILDLSKLEAGYLKVDYQQGDIIQYLRYLTESFHSMAEEKEIQLTFYPEPEVLWMDYDEEKLQHIIFNLLTNALKFTEKWGEVIFHVSKIKNKKGDQLYLKVKDNGVGIDSKKIAHIFDRFYQADDSSTRKSGGTGIGLALTKELVELLEGTIEVESKLGKGSVFIIYLPIRRSAAIKEGIVTSSTTLAIPEQSVEPQFSLPSQANTNNLPILLIVEDNKEVSAYLQRLLLGKYQIHSAENGVHGIEKALEIVPDIIISDVMMPEKNGYEVCEFLKKDQRTSHIPIILLTAKANQEDRVEGLKYGADAYLTKPFHQAELFIRLEKLIELRKELIQRYSQPDLHQKRKVSTTNMEDVFLKKIQNAVLDHLNDSSFGVEQLAQHLNLSQVQVYRKLKALTGKTTSLYIRSIRLEQAKVLLTNSQLGIAEIAYDVGFTDPSYFSRAFQKEFGTSPRDFRS